MEGNVPYSTLQADGSDLPADTTTGKNAQPEYSPPAYTPVTQGYPVQQVPQYASPQQMPQYASPQQTPQYASPQQMPQYAPSQVVVTQPQQVVVIGDKKRARANGFHLGFVISSYVMFYMALSCNLVSLPCGLIAFICALVSLCQQEQGQTSTSKVLGWVSVGFTAAGVLTFIVSLSILVAYGYSTWTYTSDEYSSNTDY